MNKKQFLNTYKKINSLNSEHSNQNQTTKTNNLYRSEHDEQLIKEYHYAKFQKNLHNAQQNDELKALLEKEEWNEEDTQVLLHSLR